MAKVEKTSVAKKPAPKPAGKTKPASKPTASKNTQGKAKTSKSSLDLEHLAQSLSSKQVKKILITQPKPESDKSPYYELAKKYGITLDFHPFILVEGITGKDFRKQKVDIAEHTAIILTSRSSVDHFFRVAEELKVKISQDMKYFCITEAVALYLQKFILYRKRKVFFSADGSNKGLLDVLNKHKNNERFILPHSDNARNEVKEFLVKHDAEFSEAEFFRTVSNDIAPVMKQSYDMIVFFSPNSVQTLFEYNPKYKQNGTMIGAFGPTTAQSIEEAGLTLQLKAPLPNAPSMVSAIELFINKDK